MSSFKIWLFMHRVAVRRTMAFAAVLGAAGGGASVYRHRQACCQACEGLDAAVQARAAGKYEAVRSALDKHRGQACWQPFREQFEKELSVKFRLEFVPGASGAPQQVPGGAVRLSTDDPYYLTVNTSAKAYVYLFQIDGAGDLRTIFPGASHSGPVAPGARRIPGDKQFLTVSARPGRERLYMVAANWEIPELQQIAQESAAAPRGETKLGARFLARAASEKQFGDPLPGLVYHEWNIESLGTPQSGGKEEK